MQSTSRVPQSITQSVVLQHRYQRGFRDMAPSAQWPCIFIQVLAGAGAESAAASATGVYTRVIRHDAGGTGKRRVQARFISSSNTNTQTTHTIRVPWEPARQLQSPQRWHALTFHNTSMIRRSTQCAYPLQLFVRATRIRRIVLWRAHWSLRRHVRWRLR